MEGAFTHFAGWKKGEASPRTLKTCGTKGSRCFEDGAVLLLALDVWGRLKSVFGLAGFSAPPQD